MTELFLLFNAVFVVLFWRWASDNFEEGRNITGWLYLFASAWNGAALAAGLF